MPQIRNLRIVSMSVSDVYIGLLEGTKEMASPFILQKAAKEFPEGENNGKLLVVPSTHPVPDWKFVAELDAYPLGDGDFSSLKLCWFDSDIGDIAAKTLDIVYKLNWAAYAKDFYH